MNIFTYDKYEELLIKLKEVGAIYKFNDEIIDRKGILLRHDIDFDIKKAFILSEIEKKNEVTSTYFVLTSSEYYNVMSAKNRQMLNEMYNNGFEIGLHFDCTVYGNVSDNELREKVKIECSVLEDIIGGRISSISLHTPSINNKYPIFQGYNNAYSEKYFQPDYYISDSCMNFRGKNIYDFIYKADENLIQVLFHPIHFNSHHSNYVTIFKNLFKNKITEFDDELKLLNKTYRGEIDNKCLFNAIIEGENCEK